MNLYLISKSVLHVSKGKFRENGSCGYVLKPEYLRSSAAMSPPVRLTIHVISGQQLPKPGAERTGEIIDPYIVINIIGKQNGDIVFENNAVFPY
jgi:hypothetical protein